MGFADGRDHLRPASSVQPRVLMGHEQTADPAASRVELDMPFKVRQDQGQARPGEIFPG
jgi:hypothetical protein